jgi:hypothetical protein
LHFIKHLKPTEPSASELKVVWVGHLPAVGALYFFSRPLWDDVSIL